MLFWLPGLDQLQPQMMSGCFLLSGMGNSFPRVTVNVFCFLSLEHTFFFLCSHHRVFGHRLTGLIVFTIYAYLLDFCHDSIPFCWFTIAKRLLKEVFWPTTETICLIYILNDLTVSRWKIGCAGRFLERFLVLSSAMTLGVMSKTGTSLGCKIQSNSSSKSFVFWCPKLSGKSATKRMTWDFIWCIQRAFATSVFLLIFTPVQ